MSNPSAPDQTAALGERLESFKPGLGNAIAGLVAALVLFVAGVALIGHQAYEVYLSGGKAPLGARGSEPGWGPVVLMSVLGLGLAAGGFALQRYARWLLSHRVEVHEGGFYYSSGASATEVGWGEITGIHEQIVYYTPGMMKGPAKLLLPKTASYSYTVSTKSGQEYDFDTNSVKGIVRLGAVLREQAARLGVPWETEERHA